MQIEGLLNVGLGLAKNERDKPLYIALKTLSKKINHLARSLQQETTASHCEKRALVSHTVSMPDYTG
jgi:hypothetical protein